MEQPQSGEIILFVAILCILGIFLWLFVLIFIKRKNKLIAMQQQAKLEFEQELSKAQLEIQEHTLRNISWELHDNIGQLMTLAKIQAQNAQDEPQQIGQAIESIGDALSELRLLSKHINPESLKSLNLIEAIQAETDRFNRLGVIKATFVQEGEPLELDARVELILFRIVQEFFTNTIKYAKATKLDVLARFDSEGIIIRGQDNGIGFNTKTQESQGMGMQNMAHRAKLIGAQFKLGSVPNKGTSLEVIYTKDTHE